MIYVLGDSRKSTRVKCLKCLAQQHTKTGARQTLVSFASTSC
uniref:Uncharacterized protein n=1 Tax=Arundo donax TaxID=35708 RepID=A0A0A9E9P3_ARUDO